MENQSDRKGSLGSNSSLTSQASPKNFQRPRQTQREDPAPPDSSAEVLVGIVDSETSQDDATILDSTISRESVSDVCICQPDPKIPRPRNAFILYRQHHQPSLVAQNPGLTEPQISKIVGEQWRRQPDEIKEEWKTRAEDVKTRHQLQYPEYRYQPRRMNRRGSTIDTPPIVRQSIPCEKCGGRSIASPTTPLLSDSSKSMLPPPIQSSGISQPHSRSMDFINNLNMLSPRHNPGTNHSILIPSIPYPSPQQMSEDIRSTPLVADNKRRRFNNGTYFLNGRQSISGPFPSISPYREVYVRADGIPKWSPLPPGFMGPPPRPMGAGRQASRLQSLILPQGRAEDQSKSVEAMVMSMPYVGKIATLGRIAPPLRLDGLTNPAFHTRGAVIAIEGDNQDAVTEAVKWLGETLGRKPEYSVRTAQGPKVPTLDRGLSVSDYLSLMVDWHSKSREIVTFVTTPSISSVSPTKERNTDVAETEINAIPAAAECTTRIPLVLLERYQLYASNAFASSIAIKDNYSPTDHWQWMATLWRDTIGPDLTVYIRDPPGEDNEDPNLGENDEWGTEISLKKEIRCIIVPRRKSTSGKEGLRVQEAELRRLAFEIGEWARLVAANPSGEAGVISRRATLEGV